MSRILIVDDDFIFVNELKQVLAAYNQFKVLSATQEGEANTALQNETVAIVVLNIDAPHIDGIEFLGLLSSSHPGTLCIVLSKYEHAVVKEVKKIPLRDSIFLYMKKPSNLKQIGGAILEALHCLDERDYTQGILVSKLLYLVEAATKTCRLNIKFGSKKQATFDILEGALINAAFGSLEGTAAASEILSWPPSSFIVTELPPEYEERINMDDVNTIRVNIRLKRKTGLLSPAAVAEKFDLSKKIKLFIVDDSAMMRKVITNIFADNERIEVVGEAANGVDALQIMPQVKPDVVTLDVQMPIMDGLSTLKRMMIQIPTPTVMLSAYTKGGSRVTYDALKYGAVDFVAKPSKTSDTDLQEQYDELINKVYLAADVDFEAVRYIRAARRNKDVADNKAVNCETIVGIGAAEGSYGTLLKIIPHLSPDLPAAYLVMLYEVPEYVDAFVDYLSELCSLKVQRAVNNESVQGGVCYLASGEEYLTVHAGDNGFVQHLSPAPFAGLRGSINMMFFSMAELMGNHSMAMIVSGLGEDGFEGMREISRVGGKGIVQEPATCLYKEMPESVIKHCEVDKITTDSKMAKVVNAMLS